MKVSIAEGNCHKDVTPFKGFMPRDSPSLNKLIAVTERIQRAKDRLHRKKVVNDLERARRVHPIKRNHYITLRLRKKMCGYRKLHPRLFVPQHKYKPQFGVEDVRAFGDEMLDIAKKSDIDITDSMIRKVEGLLALIANIRHASNIQGVISGVFLYMRDLTDRSVSSVVAKYVEDILSDKSFTAQSGVADEPNWLHIMKNANTNWGYIKSNRAFKQFCKLMSILVTLGLCDAANLEFDIEGFKLFDEKIIKKQVTAYDIVDAVMSTLTFFSEGAYLCFKKGSLKPLLVNDYSVMELDDEYVELLAMWELARNGNLERTTKYSENEFFRRLSICISDLTTLAQSAMGLDKKLLQDKILKLKNIKNDHTNRKLAQGLREAPFCLEFHGKSNQGKSIICSQFIDLLLASQNLPTDTRYRGIINTNSNFMDGWTSDMIAAILDDIANEKSASGRTPPTRMLIDIGNNQVFCAPKAEIEGKGKCFVEPKLMAVTTNVKDLDAHAYSNCPVSVQRRCHLVIHVRCRPEFEKPNGGMDSDKVKKHYTDEHGVYKPPPIDDVWLLDIEEAVEPENLKTVASYKPFVWRGKELMGISAIEGVQFAIEMFAAHRVRQRDLVQGTLERVRDYKQCSHEGCNHIEGLCPDHDVKQQFGFESALLGYRIFNKVKKRFKTDEETYLDALEKRVSSKVYERASSFIDRWDWVCLIPEEYTHNDRFIDFCEWYYADEIENKKVQVHRSHVLFSMLIMFFCWSCNLPLLGFITSTLWYLIVRSIHHVVYRNYEKTLIMDELRKRNDTLPAIVKGVRDSHAKLFFKTCVAVAGVYSVIKIMKASSKFFQKQGPLSPKSEEDIAKRDSEENVWTSVTKRALPATQASKEHIFKDVKSKVDICLHHAIVDWGEGPMMANALFLTSNVVMLPNHYFVEDKLQVTFYHTDSKSNGGRFSAQLHKATSYHVPGTDFRICYCTTGGSFPRIAKYLPTGPLVDHPFQIFWRKKGGELMDAKGYAQIGKVSNCGDDSFLGGWYKKLEVHTFEGMCGATLLSETKATVITGMHLGGISETSLGCFGTLDINQYNDAISHLQKCPGVILTGSSEVFTGRVNGKSVLRPDPLHEKSPINYLPQESQIKYHGSVIGQSSSRSDVRRTPISDAVAKHCRIKNQWGKPKMNPEWYGYQKAFANASHTGVDFDHDIMIHCVNDYLEPLEELIEKPMWRDIRPLTMEENLNGIPGVKFIDSIVINTSAGLGLPGSKAEYIIILDNGIRELKPEMLNEFEEAIRTYLRGERVHFIIKACKKDEILPLGKDKCRIFYANPMIMTLLVRKYFLPILRFLQMNPLVSECSVGINCDGPEWDEFYKHATQHGMDRIFGGDYGKYDQKLPAQVIVAGISIMIKLAEKCPGYSAEDINVMRAMTGDLVYAYIAVNGDLVSTQTGTHISGNSLTAVLNGICGSLNLRAAFYTMYDKSIPFRDAAAIMTYGDDNIGSVSPDYPHFNIKTVSEFLEKHGQVYTMPDKDSELRPYLKEDEFEFLKRTNVYNEDIDCCVGVLQEKSIFKSLHCYLRPKKAPLTPSEACATNLDNAVRQFFGYGREKYEQRREELRRVAEECDLTHMCKEIDVSYDNAVERWLDKYGLDLNSA